MGLSPIAGICEVSSASLSKPEREVAPPFAVDGTGRTDDDTYNGSGQTPERGMEEEHAEPAAELEEEIEIPAVHFFA